MDENITKDKERLEHLLQRREKYFLLEGVMRKIYQYQFEQMQKEIVSLKLKLEIYQDELDLLEVRFSYAEDCKHTILILERAAENREIRWLRKKYSPQEGFNAIYVGLVLKKISDPWLRGLHEKHLMRREGMIDCPWPMKLQEGRE